MRKISASFLAFLSFNAHIAALALPKAKPESASGRDSKCAPFNGTFTINQYQLYPENADFDFKSCLLYMGSLFNATVAIYDPYASKMVDILTFPNITHNTAYHIGGVGVDRRTGLVSIVVDAAAAFNTNGQDVSGTNLIMQWDPSTKTLAYQLNLTEITQGKYGGFQDVEQDPDGNVFVVGSLPSSIMRVDKSGKKVEPWYVAQPIVTTQFGYGGLAAADWILLANDNNGGQIVRFDMHAEKGTPIAVPHTPNTTIQSSDAIYLPPKYNSKVLLVAEDAFGVSVLRSKDGMWTSAEYLGRVLNNSTIAAGASVTAPIQIGDSLYMVEEYFGDTPVTGSPAGNRSKFPFVDITKEVEALLA
ncbi:hypothetical protein AOQ84DRAFT_361510 [Glonium stellatum]|uniref:Tri14-like protein n=1 Tax=Glonium stellatum TaxID=574774 RepID=A0A8E2JVQ5_9PEZI|nr:hypothetical protein AOQ84DRAFT_361510 [Glonium stellatum]